MEQQERKLRTRLGIPDHAEKVLIFGETSHWDPNWLFTSEEYYKKRIRSILQEVVDELEKEPRRVFSIESLFFLQLYWKREPSKRDKIRNLVNSGQLLLTGTGITTPDTLLPETEAIFRDYLLGQEWLRKHDMQVEPDLAYLPDNFGHSPALPSILSSLGFTKTAITRIDGMYFVTSDYRPRRAFPLAGSSAELLLKTHKTLDFVWRGPDTTEEVLCHWNAFTYFQGDMLAHLGIIRWMGTVFGMPWRTGAHVARRIRGFVNQLAPLSKTPYLFCPIGCDFNGPIPNLVSLLDRYNETRYPKTGVFALAAGLGDYLELVNGHRAKLPILELDPNPYWMGFYATRPDIKVRCNRIARKLVLAEKLFTTSALKDKQRGLETIASVRAPGEPTVKSSVESSASAETTEGECGHTPLQPVHDSSEERCTVMDTMSTYPPPAPLQTYARREMDMRRRLSEAWRLVVMSNHHDFITGTSPDRVWHKEQGPWLTRAERLVDRALEVLSQPLAPGPGEVPQGIPKYGYQERHLKISTRFYELVLSEDRGGCIEKCERTGEGKPLISAPSNDLIAYRDSGGLWRMGHEFLGGKFRQVARISSSTATIATCEQQGVLEVQIDSTLIGLPFRRWLWIRDDSPIIRMRVQGAAPLGHTITCAFSSAINADTWWMDVPGGVVERPAHKLYDPTFWPANSFTVVKAEQGDGFVLFMGGPACTALRKNGQVECVVLRNAPKERAFGILPLFSFPASGTDPDSHIIDYAVWFSLPGDLPFHRPAVTVRDALGQGWFGKRGVNIDDAADRLLGLDRSDVVVTTIKTADRGNGVIVRLYCTSSNRGTVRLTCPFIKIRAAWLCDARERDIAEVDLLEQTVLVPLNQATVTLRLLE
jgi:hypothetical protein